MHDDWTDESRLADEIRMGEPKSDKYREHSLSQFIYHWIENGERRLKAEISEARDARRAGDERAMRSWIDRAKATKSILWDNRRMAVKYAK